MMVFLLVAGLLGGVSVPVTLGIFAPAGDANPISGAFAHLAVSAIYGAGFGALVLLVGKRIPAWVTGILYGLMLFFIARFGFLSDTGSALLTITPGNFGIAHVVYGGVLGGLFIRKVA